MNMETAKAHLRMLGYIQRHSTYMCKDEIILHANDMTHVWKISMRSPIQIQIRNTPNPELIILLETLNGVCPIQSTSKNTRISKSQ